jgi:predicted transcriptional regulator
MDLGIDREAKRAVQRDQLNSRKRALTGESSARWANAIIAGNEDQCQLARDAQFRHIVGLRAAITTLEKRLAQPTGDMLCVEQRRQRRRAKRPKGYPTQAERFAKQRRLQALRAELARVIRDFESRRVRVVEGGRRLATSRHHLDAAGLTEIEWRQRWDCARGAPNTARTRLQGRAAVTPAMANNGHLHQ